MSTLILTLITLALVIATLFQQRRLRVWRALYLHEQAQRTELQRQLTDCDNLLGDYALALERRDAALLISKRRLNAARLQVMADMSQPMAVQ